MTPPPVPKPAPTSSDPIDIAMDQERGDPAPDSPARSLLEKHGRLADAQLRHLKLQSFNERLGAGLRLLGVLAGLAAAAALGALAWSAAHDRTAVFDAFSVPPELQARGITGEVAATRFLDHIRSIHAQSDSARPAESFANEWSNRAEVEIPGVGLSLGDLRGVLRQWLGRELHYGGEIIRTPDGYLVTARSDEVGAKTVAGTEAELDQSLRRTAEQVYCEAQPYRCASYLMRVERLDESKVVAERLARSGPVEERPWAYTILAVLYSLEGDQRRSLEAAQAAVEADPDFARGHAFVANTAYYIGLTEMELAGWRAALAAKDAQGVTAEDRAERRVDHQIQIEAMIGDFQGAASRYADLMEDDDDARDSDWAAMALNLASLHQPAQALRIAGRTAARTDAERLPYATSGAVAPVGYEAAAALDRWPEARAEIEGAVAALPPGAFWVDVLDVHLRPRLALARAHTGDLQGAAEAIAPTAPDCEPCLRARGEVAALSGDGAASDRWFAEAVRQAPSSPLASAAWGRAKLARGDVEDAIRLFRQAQERGPRWADPLKFEGDALARRGDHRAALRRYEAALERAPRWGAAHLAAGRSLAALRQPERAAAAYRRALGLDLSAADRTEAARRLQGLQS